MSKKRSLVAQKRRNKVRRMNKRAKFREAGKNPSNNCSLDEPLSVCDCSIVAADSEINSDSSNPELPPFADVSEISSDFSSTHLSTPSNSKA